MDQNSKTCKNCSHSFNGKFCPNCGQKHIDSFTWSHLFHHLTRTIEFEKGFLHNIRDLTIRPVQMIDSYLNGKTKDYLNPITYFLIVITLITILSSVTNNLAYQGFEAKECFPW